MKPSLVQRFFIGLGSNLGDRHGFLKGVFQAVSAQPDFTNVAISSVYETKPVGGDGENYFNAVIAFDSEWDVSSVYEWMMDLESKAGRVRTRVNAPRTLDLDLLFHGSEISGSSRLTIPHARLHERAFVLVPLCEIAPDWIHPIYKKSMREMQNALSAEALQEVKKI